MTWGKMDDKFHRNRKVRDLRRRKGGREALGVWVFWWSWCLDDPTLEGIVPAFELDAAEKKAADLLVEVGLWERVADGFRFHDFHEYNPRREQLDAKREADRRRIAEKRSASRHNVARDTFATSDGHASESHSDAPRVASTRDPVPSRPVPIPAEREQRAHEAPPAPPEPDYDPTEPLPTSAPPLRRVAPRDDLRAKLLAAWLEGYGNQLGLQPHPSTKGVAEYLDMLAGKGATPETVLAAAEELSRQRWWHDKGLPPPRLKHFAENFEGYHVAACERSATGSTRERPDEARERAQREYDAMHAGGG